MTADEKTLAFYDSEAPSYANWSVPEGEFGYLEKFLSKLEPGARLLDYACGGGWAAERMVKAGFVVEAFDGSAGLAVEASKRTGLSVRHLRIEDFAEQDRYDGLWCSFCLLHLPRAAMPGNLRRIHAALRPGGLLYLGLKAGEPEEKRDRLGRFYSYFAEDEIRGWLQDAGFAEIDIRLRGGQVGYEGEPAVSMYTFARRP